MIMIKKIPIKLVKDFPVICDIYKQNLKGIDSHIVIGARIIDKNVIDELADSISRDGLRHPVTVRMEGNGYQMIDGHVRKYALKKLIRGGILANIIEADDLASRVMLITNNRLQHPLEAIEESWVIKELIEKHKQSLRECANLIGVSKSWVYHRYILARQLVNEIQLDIVMGIIPARIACEIASVHARGQLKLAETIKRHKLSYRESHELIKIIKDREISDRIKELAIDDPRTVIKKQSGNKVISYSSKTQLSYFANNFREEVNRLISISLELTHRIKRDFGGNPPTFGGFSKFEKQILLKGLTIVDKRIQGLSNVLKGVGIDGQKFNL